MLDHTPVKHSRRHIPPTTFLLQVIQTLENDAFPMGETVSNIGERVTRIMGRHRSMLFALVSLMDSSLWSDLLQLLFDTE